MKILEFLNTDAISLNLESEDKEGVISELVELLVKAGEVKEKDKVVKVIMNRESLGSTGIGQGVAIPHGKTDAVRKLIASFGISRKGINFDSLDGEPAYIFFLLIAPQNSAGPHLKALARIAGMLKDKFCRDSLKNVKDHAELMKIFAQEDQKKR
ncbi:MAG: PTS sugar transporter subunit IIA [Candidatus Omnitrophica bacterium]|nr:PTS sugar transporter subunit IIA [Candidatus Omnitrophota bacterium]